MSDWISKKKILEWIESEIRILEDALDEHGDYLSDYYRGSCRGELNSLFELRRLIRKNKFG